MHLTGIKLGNIPPFTDPITLRFDERVNVFIGPNASGKSRVLEVVKDSLLGPEENAKRPVSEGNTYRRATLVSDDEFGEIAGPSPEDWAKGNFLFASEDWLGTKEEYIQTDVPPATVYIGSVREGLPGISSELDPDDSWETGEDALTGPFSGLRTFCACMLLGTELRELGDELKQQGEDSPYMKLSALRDAEKLAGSCSQGICDEVIRDPRLERFIPYRYARRRLLDPHGDPNDLVAQSSFGIRTTDKPNFANFSPLEQPDKLLYGNDENAIPIPISHLSSGTEGTLLWILWLALKLAHHYNFDRGTERDPEDRSSFKDSWDKKPGILLIDEIENHLHPTWQRRVIPALLEHFPGLQIFATTHSPFVVAGLKAGQVHKLDRDANGVVKATTETRDVVGWTMDEILRGMMGVDDPTDAETARAAAELRQLRSGEPKTDKKEEELRQQRIQELRAVVDRDLLAGGPVAAQRELFERNLVEILEEHRKAQGLNQD